MSHQLDPLLESWPSQQQGLKEALLTLQQTATSLPDCTQELVSRPGVSHSLRFSLEPRPDGRKRPLFCLLDVVPLEGEYFLSVCFYQEEINDPQELGNAIPQGLFGETGYCFDLDDDDPALVAYLQERIREAHAAARGGGK